MTAELTPIAGTLVAMLEAELDATDDGDLTAAIATATATLGTKYTLPPVPVVTATTLTTYVDGRLIHPEYLASLASVTDLNDADLTYESTTEGGFVTRIILDAAYDGYVKVTGTWGCATYPSDIARAIVITAATQYRRTQRGEEGGFVGRLDAIPKEAVDIMDARRVVTI